MCTGHAIGNKRNGGLGLLQRRCGFVGVKATAEGKSVVMVRAESDRPQEVASVPLDQETVHLKAECDFNDRADTGYFYYSTEGHEWHRIGEPLDMAYTVPHFMGYRFALFNFATQTPGGFVDFDFYRVNPAMTGAQSSVRERE